MRNTYSFDVFDTCLCRLCGEPRLLFDVLSLKVQKAMGDGCTEHLRQLFVAARATAGGKTLEEIYNDVAQRYPLPCSVEQMVEMELETEREMLAPIVATRQLVDSLREKGDIVFISDMYLPSAFIREQLAKHGFFKDGDRLFVSDELGAWKRDGSLYRYVKEQLGISYRHWHHYGDNRGSDYTVPRRLGIRAHYIHYDYLPYEEQWRKMPVLQYQYPAIMAGVARATRLSSDAPEDQKAFVCDISAPLMVSWVLNIMADAQQRGIRRLYFCARDVHTEYLIAKQLQPMFPRVEVRYLFISGPALYKCSLCLDYLNQEGLNDGTPVAIVDSCTSGETLRTMNRLIRQNGGEPVHGYFLVQMSPSSNKENEPSEVAHYELQTGYLDAVASRAARRIGGMRIMPELIFSINFHKKTYGYEYHGRYLRPVFKDDDDDQWLFDNNDVRTMKRHNDTLLSKYANSIVSAGLIPHSKPILDFLAFPTLTDYLDCPRKEYLRYLLHFFWWNKPFVGHISGKHKGVWKRGNLFYSLPCFITTPLRIILGNPALRRRLNQLL